MSSYDDDRDVAAVTFDNDDGSVVVIIGSGAGGGVLANEHCQKGIDVVLLDGYRCGDHRGGQAHRDGRVCQR